MFVACLVNVAVELPAGISLFSLGALPTNFGCLNIFASKLFGAQLKSVIDVGLTVRQAHSIFATLAVFLFVSIQIIAVVLELLARH